MSNTEIAAPPVLLPLTAVSIVVVLWRLRSRGDLTAPRAATGVAACVYGAIVLNLTFFPFTIAQGDSQPWHVWLNLTPFTDVFDDPIGIALNVALFVPVGLLMPLLVRVPSAGRALSYGFVLSLGIEIVQFAGDLVVGTGRVADIDDLIGNAVGALIGYAVFRLVMFVPVLSRAAVLASWRTISGGAAAVVNRDV